MEDREIELSAGDWTVRTAPWGGALRGATWRGRPVATGYSGRSAKCGGEGDVLIPFPGRIAGAEYDFNGVRHRLDPTDSGGRHAIHGFVRDLPWEVAGQSKDAVSYLLAFAGAPGFPFPLEIGLVYRVDADGLSCATTVRNTGQEAAPVAVGFHPYFVAGDVSIDDSVLTLPFDSVLEFERLIPTGQVLPVGNAGVDWRGAKPIGRSVIDNCFLHPMRDDDGLARVTLAGPDHFVEVWMDEAYDYCVLFTGDTLPDKLRRKALAIEPMSCGSDAFHHPDWGLRVLAPGESFHGTWGVRARSAG
ncbi:MAG: aldose epimerase [Armatimonadota bacterium]